MKTLTISRFGFGANQTIGRATLRDDAEPGRILFECFSLEPPTFPWVRENARDVSCIPVGTYALRSGVFHRNTPDEGDDYPCLVVPDGDVPDRGPGIKVHAGNTAKSTKGCVLVGNSIGFLADRVAVLSSRRTLARLVESFGEETGFLVVEELRT